VISPLGFLWYTLVAATVANLDAGALALIWPGPTQAKLAAYAASALLLAVIAGKGSPYQHVYVSRRKSSNANRGLPG
jgi:hypothetical protein